MRRGRRRRVRDTGPASAVKSRPGSMAQMTRARASPSEPSLAVGRGVYAAQFFHDGDRPASGLATSTVCSLLGGTYRSNLSTTLNSAAQFEDKADVHEPGQPASDDHAPPAA